MGFKIVLTQPAMKDLLFTMDWYDEQQQNLGYKFYQDYVAARHYLILNPFCSEKAHVDFTS